MGGTAHTSFKIAHKISQTSSTPALVLLINSMELIQRVLHSAPMTPQEQQMQQMQAQLMMPQQQMRQVYAHCRQGWQLKQPRHSQHAALVSFSRASMVSIEQFAKTLGNVIHFVPCSERSCSHKDGLKRFVNAAASPYLSDDSILIRTPFAAVWCTVIYASIRL